MVEPATSSTHEETAKKLKRDATGHFLKVESEAKSDELVNLKIHNPAKKLEELVDDIRKHHQTTVSFQAKIPLLAVITITGIILGLSSFQLGRLLPFCPSFPTTRIGTLYVLSVVEAPPRSIVELISPWSKPTQPTNQTKTILVEKDTTTTLEVAKGNSFFNLHGLTVAVTGEFQTCTSSLKVIDARNVTVVTKL